MGAVARAHGAARRSGAPRDRRVALVESPRRRDAAQAHGVETIGADLLDPRAARRAARRAERRLHGGAEVRHRRGNPATTWAMNAAVPAFVAERYAGARIVAFSTGNVYPLTPAGARRLARERRAGAGRRVRVLVSRRASGSSTAAAARTARRVAIVRLNYALDLRYGVLVDLALRVVARRAGRPAHGIRERHLAGRRERARARRARARRPRRPFVVNVAGPETLRVADLARALGERLGVEPVLRPDAKAPTRCSATRSRMRELLGPPAAAARHAARLGRRAGCARGGPLLGKPTNFERRDGRF